MVKWSAYFYMLGKNLVRCEGDAPNRCCKTWVVLFVCVYDRA